MDNQSREKRKRRKNSDSATSQDTSYNDSLRKAPWLSYTQGLC